MKTLLILSDGMRPDSIENHKLTKMLKKKSTYCMNAQTVYPSVTLPCHMSLFHSVVPERHGITTNIYMPPVRPIDGLFECLKHAGNKCAMLYNWEELRDLAKPGSLTRSEYYAGHIYGYEESNRYLCQTAKSWLKDGEIDFTFLYLGWVDGAGHKYGWNSEEYMYAVNQTCDMIADVMEALSDKYTIIVTADHGGHDRGHGSDLPEDMTIPVFFYGSPFTPAKEISGVNIIDIAPTIAHLHKATLPAEWEGSVIE